MTKKQKIALAKKITRRVVGYSVTAVIITLIHQNIVTDKKRQVVQLYIGAFVIGEMISDKAEDWTDDKFDTILDAFEQISSFPHTKKD
jgi:hypothetical protein